MYSANVTQLRALPVDLSDMDARLVDAMTVISLVAMESRNVDQVDDGA